MEEAGTRAPVLPIITYPSYILRNVLRQRKDAKQASAVLDTAPQPILVPPKQDKHTSNVTPRPLISKAQRKTSHIDLLRRHERLFRVGLVLCLHLAFNLAYKGKTTRAFFPGCHSTPQ